MSGKARYYGVMLDETPESEEIGEGAIEHRLVSAVEMTYGLLEQQPGRNLIRRAQETTTAIIAYDPSASGALEDIRGRDDEATNLNEQIEAGGVRALSERAGGSRGRTAGVRR